MMTLHERKHEADELDLSQIAEDFNADYLLIINFVIDYAMIILLSLLYYI